MRLIEKSEAHILIGLLLVLLLLLGLLLSGSTASGGTSSWGSTASTAGWDGSELGRSLRDQLRYMLVIVPRWFVSRSIV